MLNHSVAEARPIGARVGVSVRSPRTRRCGRVVAKAAWDVDQGVPPRRRGDGPRQALDPGEGGVPMVMADFDVTVVA